MRAFIAIEANQEVKEQAKEIIEILKKQDFFKGNYVDIGNLHLTLKFLGETSEERVKKIKKELNKLDIRKFKARLNRLGFFSPKFIKVLWIGIDSEKLKEIHDKIDNSLEDFFPKDKKFNNHITIARVKKLNKEKKKDLLDFIEKQDIQKVEFDVDKIKLKKSTLTPDGPIYEDVFVKELK
jgi:2'-5' RNA ligase